MNNYTSYFAIEKKLKETGFDVDRSQIVQQFTDGQKKGLRELTKQEYNELINWLNSTFTSRSEIVRDKLSVQRRKIIALLVKIGYSTPDHKADMPRIYSWVLNYGYLHKPLNSYNMTEMPRLVSQVEKFYQSHIERL